MDFTVYRLSDGQIVRFGTCREYDIHSQAEDGEVVYVGAKLRDDQWRFDLETGAPVAFVPPPSRNELIALVIRERAKRLAAGFDYDFGDERGVHRIGTTEDDRKGWDEVSDLASTLIDIGNPDGEIQIVTDTGPATVTAAEWKQILLAASQFRQPIWAASFVLQAMDPIPQDVTANTYWP